MNEASEISSGEDEDESKGRKLRVRVDLMARKIELLDDLNRSIHALFSSDDLEVDILVTEIYRLGVCDRKSEFKALATSLLPEPVIVDDESSVANSSRSSVFLSDSHRIRSSRLPKLP